MTLQERMQAPSICLPINAHSAQKQPGNFGDIFQVKAKLREYLKEKCKSVRY